MEVAKLESLELTHTDQYNLLEGVVSGKKLYFKAPASFPLARSANPFLAAMLVPSMHNGVDVVIPDSFPVSKKLLRNIDELQSILSAWFPQLHRISIDAPHADADPANTDHLSAGCLFSGGVDACCAAMKHAAELTHLIYVRGIDLQLDNDRVFAASLDCNREIANHLGKELVVLESNVRFFMRDLERSPLSWYVNQAGGLASVCLALNLPRVFIGSSNPYDALHPFGSHPLTDPMWSTEATRIIHTGCEMRRHEKLEKIANEDPILQRIRVCWHDSDFNCGVCDKCVHYRVALTILGLQVESMPLLDDFGQLYGAHVNTEGEYAEWHDNLLLAQKYGNKAAEAAVRKLLNRYKTKSAIKLLDEALLGGRLRSLKLRGKTPR